ncbi:MAG: ABC transporter permease [Thermoguttaceae bacterium]
MYKLLLCWRYLRTRYIALASIISVMLGVATMIVVNSVMQGFGQEMQDRIHSMYSDLIFRSVTLDGMADPERHEAQIRKVAGDQIEGMSPIVMTEAILNFQSHGMSIVRQVSLVGIDEKTQSLVSGFGRYLQHPANRDPATITFDLRRGGYDTRDRQSGPEAPERKDMRDAGWVNRERMARESEFRQEYENRRKKPVAAPADDPFGKRADPFAPRGIPGGGAGTVFDRATQQNTGIVLGIALACFRTSDGQDRFSILPGDDVKLTFPTNGQPPKAVSDDFTVVDFYESKMAEADGKMVFVPIRKLQELRGMIDPSTGVGFVNAIQIKLKPGVDGDAVRNKLQAAFPCDRYSVCTWRDMQSNLLNAVEMEITVLNILLFFIIAVAGFGILAIFYMIVVEKTRDIGILKSLGASRRGVMGIFLGYGLSLGLVGSGVGMVAGLLFVRYINEIAGLVGWLRGRPVFDPSVYYFYKIPAVVMPETVFWVVVGALMIAVAASILPARRAARLHPVEALRYE